MLYYKQGAKYQYYNGFSVKSGKAIFNKYIYICIKVVLFQIIS